jgi:hypothetical protein
MQQRIVFETAELEGIGRQSQRVRQRPLRRLEADAA